MSSPDTNDLPGSMLGVFRAGTEDHPRAEIHRVPVPAEEEGRVLVEVVAAGITKMEPHWITGWQYADGTKRRNTMVLGCEFAGRVHSANMRDATFADGQSVVGMTGQYRKGAMAQFVSARTADLLPMPEALSFEGASTLPLAGLTAWQALIRYGKLAQGERVLIHGGAGGVGTFAIQIAHWAGAHIVTTAASGDADLCRRLGADEVIDYEHQRFDEGGNQYDLVFDQIGGDVQERSWHVLTPGGRLVTIAGEETDAPNQDRAKALGVSACFFIVDRNTSELSRLIELVRDGVIKPIIGKRFTMATAEQAFDDRSGRFAGKAVLLCQEDGSSR